MPKAHSQPLAALFAINKPTGVPSMTLLNNLQPLFSSSKIFRDPNKADGQQGNNKKFGKYGRRGKGRGRDDKVKMGQGGTLDPLADGVLVVGTNAATKSLSRFLDCTKEYRAIGLFGCTTDSYDSDGKWVRKAAWDSITRERVESVLDQFRGEIEQTPPVYSALKMDGKPLYEYARSGTPLPRPIPTRKVTVHALKLLRFETGDRHENELPRLELEEDKRKELERLEKMVREGRTTVPTEEEVATTAPSADGSADPEADGTNRSAPTETASSSSSSTNPPALAPASNDRPPIFEIQLTVSSGTYIRSIVHDIGLALGSAAHVVKLTRTRQGEFVLDPPRATTVLDGEVGGAPETAAAAAAEEAPKPQQQQQPNKLELETFSGGCIEWSLLEKAIAAHAEAKKEGRDEVTEGRDEDGWLEWERELLSKCKEV
ncbi:pseudouridine synthase [Rhodotorula sp. JG-1b]|nr:pseudouridine synthase [Rhodotorula sp. JG-1b]